MKKSTCKKLLAIAMSLFIAMSYVPSFVFADAAGPPDGAAEITEEVTEAAQELQEAETEAESDPAEVSEGLSEEPEESEQAGKSEKAEKAEKAEAEGDAEDASEDPAEAAEVTAEDKQDEAAEPEADGKAEPEVSEEASEAEDADAELVQEEEEDPEPETSDEAFDASKSDYLSYDPLYVLKYADKSLVNLDELDMSSFFNLVTIAKGVATYNVDKQSAFEITEDNYLAGMTYEVPVYNVDENSAYYVAIPNVNKFNPEFKEYDVMLTYNNDYGEVIRGWKYKNGIMYIPKAAVDKPKNTHEIPDEEILGIQINYAIGGDMDFSKAIPLQLLSGGEPSDMTVTVPNIFDKDVLYMDTGMPGRNHVSVFLNGSVIPIRDEAYEYEKGTGYLRINEMPGVVSNINIVFDDETIKDKAKDLVTGALDSVVTDVYAGSLVTQSGMKFFKTASGKEIELDVPASALFTGWRGYYSGSYKHGYGKVHDLNGWSNSIQYMYGGWNEVDYSKEGNSNAQRNKEMAGTWAFTSFAAGSDFQLGKDNAGKITQTEKVRMWNDKTGKYEKKTIYDWLLVYRNRLEKTKQNESKDSHGNLMNNGLGGLNNHAFTFPKKIKGATRSLISSGTNKGRKNPSFTIEPDILEKYAVSGKNNYDYWICASCNHLNTSVDAEEDDGQSHKIYVTCLGTGSDWAVLAFARSASGGQNSCGVYKFRCTKTNKVKVKKSFKEAKSKYPSDAALEGAVYYLYTNEKCTTRAKDVLGNKIKLVTDKNGNSDAVEVFPGTYYLKEITPSDGCELDETVHKKKITATMDSPVVIESKEPPDETHGGARVRKRTRTAVMNFAFAEELPGNYSFKGAVYKMYTDKKCTKAAKDVEGNTVGELTTNENGYTPVVPVKAGTYYFKEITTSKGYLLDDTVREVTVTAADVDKGNTKTVTSYEPPVYDKIGFELRKYAKVPDDVDKEKIKPDILVGTKYTISYYDIDISSTAEEVDEEEPDRTWYVQTTKDMLAQDDNGDWYAAFDFNKVKTLSGSDKLFKDADGNVVMPRGMFTIQESECDSNLKIDDTLYVGRVYQAAKGEPVKHQVRYALPEDGPAVSLNNSEQMSFSLDTANDKIVLKHIDLKDPDGGGGGDGDDTEDEPSGITLAVNDNNGTRCLYPGPGASITDTVQYSGFNPKWIDTSWYDDEGGYHPSGYYHYYTCEIDGEIYDLTLGRTTGVTGSTSFTVTSSSQGSGTADVHFSFDATGMEGHTLVVYEDILRDGSPAASHKDNSDSGQTIRIPKISTSASISSTNDIIDDDIEYENLLADHEYVFRGWLVDTKTGQKIPGSDGEEKLGKGHRDGNVTVSMETKEYDNMYGHSMTCFEELYIIEGGKEYLVAEHKDLNDTDQTIEIYQDIRVKKNVTGDLGDLTKEFRYTTEFTDLVPGMVYTISGDDPKTFSANGAGTATVDLKLKDDQEVVIEQIPKSATYKVTEAASDHINEYKVFSEDMADSGAKIASAAGTNKDSSARALATAKETADLFDGTVVIFWQNNRDLATITAVPSYLNIWAGAFAGIVALTALVFIRRKKYEEDAD